MTQPMFLKLNGAFLALMGLGAAVADAAGHFWGKGPFGGVMFRSPLAIGSFEAHLLAVIIGVLLWRGASSPERRLFHLTAAVVHVVLGGSNLLFFESAFGALDLRVFGAVVTAIHVGFVVGEGWAASRCVPVQRAPTLNASEPQRFTRESA